MTQLGLLSQKAKVLEETRAYRVISAQELTGTTQQALMEANEARRIGIGHIHGTLSGKILMGICCALIDVTQLASRVPADEEVKALKKTVETFVQVNADLRTRLEKLENRGPQPVVDNQQPAACSQPQLVKEGTRKRTCSSPEEVVERKREGEEKAAENCFLLIVPGRNGGKRGSKVPEDGSGATETDASGLPQEQGCPACPGCAGV